MSGGGLLAELVRQKLYTMRTLCLLKTRPVKGYDRYAGWAVTAKN